MKKHESKHHEKHEKKEMAHKAKVASHSKKK